KDIGKKTKTLIQLFNPDAILSTKHIYYAVYYGLTSFLKGINISNDRNLEIILYASQQRQINVALKIMGLNYEGLGVNTHDNFNNLIYFAVEGNSEDAINHALRDLTQLLINTSSDKAFDQNISTISPPNRKKIYDIKKLFNVSDNEIRISLMTLGFPEKLLINEINDKNLEDALLGCIIERMALLSLENASKL
ncbi:MAG: KEOPS complex subunit Cgi121, partial [Promethearchaeota archaeon]